MATDVTAASLTEQVRWAREERARVGQDPESLSVAVHLPTFPFAGDADDAWRRVRAHQHYVAWKYEDMERARSRKGPPPAPPPLSDEQERDLREGILLGTAGQVAEQIRALADAAGGDLHYIARLYWPGMDPGLQRDTVRLFGEAVAPLLR